MFGIFHGLGSGANKNETDERKVFGSCRPFVINKKSELKRTGKNNISIGFSGLHLARTTLMS